MIEIKPEIKHQSTCPHCSAKLIPQSVLWQGIHVCVVSTCPQCSAEITEDLRVGHALHYPYQVDVRSNEIFPPNQAGLSWFGTPLLRALKHPATDFQPDFKVEKMLDKKDIVILNCIDYLYGHSVLKLLNAETHINRNPETGLIVIVPSFLRWMAPKGTAEIWTVTIPLSKAWDYYPSLNERMQKECLRFRTIYVSRAHSHPKDFTITNFTGVSAYDHKNSCIRRITYIWREDRLWHRNPSPAFITKFFIKKRQNLKVRHLFRLLRKNFPQAVFTVAGLGTSTKFPTWIDDQRVSRFNDDIERKLCTLYADSTVIIGVHGSNMLLPSAHAGMTMDLMPDDRWGNFAQDILYQENDSRVASYRYRFVPIIVNVKTLALMISAQLRDYAYFKMQMKDEFKEELLGSR